MTFSRPTLTQLIDRVSQDLVARFPGADSALRRATLPILARVWAGALNDHYGYLDHTADQVLPDTADADGLERWASIWGLARVPSTPATGSVVLTGEDGSTVPAGTLLQRGKVDYATLADATIAGGVATVAAQALAPGAAGLVAAGRALTLISPVPGVAGLGIAAAGGLIGGADEESDEALRSRLLARLRERPRGGTISDYQQWSLEFSPRNTRVWVRPAWSGAGSVGVAFTHDNEPTIIPSAGDVAALQAQLDQLRPVTAVVTVFAPTPKPINLTIHVTPDNAGVRAAVAGALTDLLFREAAPGATIDISHIHEAVSSAAGEVDHVISAPTANIACLPAELAVLGAITWT